MKIATSLSNLGIEEFIKQNNHYCKKQYLLQSIDTKLANHIDSKLDIIADYPVFKYELSAHHTKDGTPKRIELNGHEYFNWLAGKDKNKK